MTRKRVLLVDDVATVRLALRIILSGIGCDVTSTNCGKDALKILDTETFDLVVCDIMMPEIDGIELCRRIKSNYSTRSIPVIIVSSQGQKKRREDAAEAGCVDFLVKPVSKSDMIVATHKWTR